MRRIDHLVVAMIFWFPMAAGLFIGFAVCYPVATTVFAAAATALLAKPVRAFLRPR